MNSLHFFFSPLFYYHPIQMYPAMAPVFIWVHPFSCQMLHRHCYLLESIANLLSDIFWFSFRTANWIMYLPFTHIDIDFIPCTICSPLVLLWLIIFLVCRWLLIGLFSFVSSIRELLNSVGCVRLSETILPISTSIVIKEIVLIWLHLKAYNCILIHGSSNLKSRPSFPFGRFVPEFTYFSSLHNINVTLTELSLHLHLAGSLPIGGGYPWFDEYGQENAKTFCFGCILCQVNWNFLDIW